MKKSPAKMLIAALCAGLLLAALAACGEKAEPLVIDGYAAEELEKGVYYVEAVILESDPGENPDALASAKTAWAELKRTWLADEAGDRNIYISLRRLDTVNDGDAYLYSVGAGSEYEAGEDYFTAYEDIAVNYAGDVLAYSLRSGEWEPLIAG